MSRILRRPMFRGGRVDSRGTGIASGLGYNKGGRVGLETSYAGTVGNAYDKMIAKQNQWMNTKAVPQDYHTQQEKWKAYEPKYKTYEDLENAWQTELDNESALIDSYMIEGPLTPDADLYEREKWLQSEGGKTYWMDEQKAKQDEEIKAAKAFNVDIPTDLDKLINSEKKELTLAEQRSLLDQEYADKTAAFFEDQLSKGTPEEEIEKNKAIFQKAYGSGVPEDASRMLLSAASRLLEPEATVKSGLGKFFGDESKVESKRGKYKDAATTAAINAYLTGKKDFSTFMNQMKAMEHGVEYIAAADAAKQKNYTVTDYVQGDKKNSEGKAIEIATRKVMENKKIPGKIEKIKGKENTDELLVEENINKVFYDTDNKEVFLVTIVDGEIVKDYTDWYR